jgi:hypothetical protein
MRRLMRGSRKTKINLETCLEILSLKSSHSLRCVAHKFGISHDTVKVLWKCKHSTTNQITMMLNLFSKYPSEVEFVKSQNLNPSSYGTRNPLLLCICNDGRGLIFKLTHYPENTVDDCTTGQRWTWRDYEAGKWMD